MPIATANAHPYPKEIGAYKLLEEIGEGSITKVYRARCRDEDVGDVAVKVLQLEHLIDSATLVEIHREMETMLRLSHPNLVKYHCSFVENKVLWLVMTYLSGGSALHLLKWKHCKGFDENVISTLMKGVLKACDYCHRNQLNHRDIKAGNVLVDAEGNVKLADFGVSASCWGSMEYGRTFTDTPCWMAPEVFRHQSNTSESTADIWSIGITILELIYGCEPFEKMSPMKLLEVTLEDGAGAGGKLFSRGLKEVIAMCLHKDPEKRPTATQLLEYRFIREGKKKEYLIKNLLEGQPSLGERMRKVNERKAQKRAQMTNGVEGAPAVDSEEKNRINYKKGMTSWSFDPAERMVKWGEEREREDADRLANPHLYKSSSHHSHAVASWPNSANNSMPSTPTGSQHSSQSQLLQAGAADSPQLLALQHAMSIYPSEENGAHCVPPMPALTPSHMPSLTRVAARDGAMTKVDFLETNSADQEVAEIESAVKSPERSSLKSAESKDVMQDIQATNSLKTVRISESATAAMKKVVRISEVTTLHDAGSPMGVGGRLFVNANVPVLTSTTAEKEAERQVQGEQAAAAAATGSLGLAALPSNQQAVLEDETLGMENSGGAPSNSDTTLAPLIVATTVSIVAPGGSPVTVTVPMPDTPQATENHNEMIYSATSAVTTTTTTTTTRRTQEFSSASNHELHVDAPYCKQYCKIPSGKKGRFDVYDEEDEEETAKEGGDVGERFSRVSSEPLPTREIAIPSDKFRPSPSIQGDHGLGLLVTVSPPTASSSLSPSTGFPALPEKSTLEGAAAEGKREKEAKKVKEAKETKEPCRKGRFSIMHEGETTVVEQSHSEKKKKEKSSDKSIQRHSSRDRLDKTESKTARNAQLEEVNWLLPKLQSLQAQQQAQQQAVQDLVKHLVKMDGDLPDDKKGGGVERHPYERFRDNEVVTEVSSKMAGAPCTSEMSEGTLNKIVALLEENVQLKQRNKDLERKLNQSENKNQELTDRIEGGDLDRGGDSEYSP